MGIKQYQLQWQDNGVVVTCNGALTSGLIKEMNEAVLGCDDFIFRDFVILNAQGVDQVYANENDMAFFGASDAAASTYLAKKDMQFAIVTKNEKMRRIFNVYKKVTLEAGSSWHIEIFPSFEIARQWVGVK